MLQTDFKMTTTNLYSGIGEKNSSRVLKPPGGGHSNIFGEPDACPIRARPKNNQQNSSNLAFVCGTLDANEKVMKAAAPEPAAPPPEAAAAPQAAAPAPANPSARVERSEPAPPKPQPAADSGKPRVPPGGYSAGFW